MKYTDLEITEMHQKHGTTKVTLLNVELYLGLEWVLEHILKHIFAYAIRVAYKNLSGSFLNLKNIDGRVKVVK